MSDGAGPVPRPPRRPGQLTKSKPPSRRASDSDQGRRSISAQRRSSAVDDPVVLECCGEATLHPLVYAMPEQDPAELQLATRAEAEQQLHTVPILPEQVHEYIVDNSVLNAETLGLGFRHSKLLEDQDWGNLAAWGSVVVGVDEGDGWVRVGERFLPVWLDSAEVLRPQDRPRADPTAPPPRQPSPARARAAARVAAARAAAEAEGAERLALSTRRGPPRPCSAPPGGGAPAALRERPGDCSAEDPAEQQYPECGWKAFQPSRPRSAPSRAPGGTLPGGALPSRPWSAAGASSVRRSAGAAAAGAEPLAAGTAAVTSAGQDAGSVISRSVYPPPESPRVLAADAPPALEPPPSAPRGRAGGQPRGPPRRGSWLSRPSSAPAAGLKGKGGAGVGRPQTPAAPGGCATAPARPAARGGARGAPPRCEAGAAGAVWAGADRLLQTMSFTRMSRAIAEREATARVLVQAQAPAEVPEEPPRPRRSRLPCVAAPAPEPGAAAEGLAQARHHGATPPTAALPREPPWARTSGGGATPAEPPPLPQEVPPWRREAAGGKPQPGPPPGARGHGAERRGLPQGADIPSCWVATRGATPWEREDEDRVINQRAADKAPPLRAAARRAAQ